MKLSRNAFVRIALGIAFLLLLGGGVFVGRILGDATTPPAPIVDAPNAEVTRVIYGLTFHLSGCPEFVEDEATTSTIVTLKSGNSCVVPDSKPHQSFRVYSGSQFSFEHVTCEGGEFEQHQPVGKGTHQIAGLLAGYSETTLCKEGSAPQQVMRLWSLPDGGVITTITGRPEGSAPMEEIFSKVTR